LVNLFELCDDARTCQRQTENPVSVFGHGLKRKTEQPTSIVAHELNRNTE